MERLGLAAPPEHGTSESLGTLAGVPGGWGGDVDNPSTYPASPSVLGQLLGFLGLLAAFVAALVFLAPLGGLLGNLGFLGLLAAFLAAYVAAAPLIVTLKQQKKMKVNNTHAHA